jgi:hypothetical protein
MYLVLSPLAQNIGTVGLQAIRALVMVTLAVILLTILLKFLLQDKRRSGLVVTVVLLFVGTYGHLSEFLGSLIPLAPLAEVLLLVLWIALAAGCLFWLIRRLQQPEPWHLTLNAVGLVLLVFPMYRILTYTRAAPVVAQQAVDFQRQMLAENGLDQVEAEWSGAGEPSDIFYLILDGYARQDVLLELYDFDNGTFIQELEARDFQVAGAAESNYPSTTLSIASTLNMLHINRSPAMLNVELANDPNALLNNGLSYLIGHNKLANILHDENYQLISFDSGYGGAQLAEADQVARSPEITDVNAGAAFELMLLDTSIGRTLLKLRGEDFTPLGSLFDDHRERVRFGIQHLSDFSAHAGPQFVFSHVISPHYPYVFGPNGEPRYGSEPFSLLQQEGVGAWEPGLYTDQVRYINSLVLAEVDEILAENGPDTIIIIHADHSGRSWGELEPAPEIQRQLLFPVLLAVHAPGEESEPAVPADTSLVNLNRILLNQFFGTELAMLPNTNYLLERSGNKVEFIRACQAFGDC